MQEIQLSFSLNHKVALESYTTLFGLFLLFFRSLGNSLYKAITDWCTSEACIMYCAVYSCHRTSLYEGSNSFQTFISHLELVAPIGAIEVAQCSRVLEEMVAQEKKQSHFRKAAQSTSDLKYLSLLFFYYQFNIIILILKRY